MIFFDGLLYRLSLKTAVLLRVHLQILSPSYDAHKYPLYRVQKRMFLLLAFGCPLAFGCTLSFNRRCLQKFLHRLQPSSIIIFLHSKTNTNTCVHTYFLKICYFRDVYWRFTKQFLHCLHVVESSSSSSSYS